MGRLVVASKRSALGAPALQGNSRVSNLAVIKKKNGFGYLLMEIRVRPNGRI
jgi:hypothetical protein